MNKILVAVSLLLSINAFSSTEQALANIQSAIYKLQQTESILQRQLYSDGFQCNFSVVIGFSVYSYKGQGYTKKEALRNAIKGCISELDTAADICQEESNGATCI